MFTPRFVTIINDCLDDNAMGRQATRVATLLGCSVNTIGVKNDLEAAGTLVDVLDAAEGGEGFVLVNVAPRSSEAWKKRENGSPFGYVRYGDTRILSTVDGYTLTLVQQLLGLDWCTIFDIPSVVSAGIKFGLISPDAAERISSSQFRSFDFSPRLAKLITHEVPLLTERYSLLLNPESTGRVWLIDCFGNVKTTLLPDQIDFEPGNFIRSVIGEVLCYESLSDVPDGETGLIVGSSGLENKRLLELVVQGASAQQRFNIHQGQIFF